MLVDRAPEPLALAFDLELDLIQRPLVAGACASPSQTSGIARAECGAPGAARLVRNGYPALGEQLFDVPEAEMKPNIEPYRMADDLDRVAIATLRRRLMGGSSGRRHLAILRGHPLNLTVRVFCKLTMTSRCKSGQRRYQGTFVAACRRAGRPGRRSAGSSPPWEGATHQSAASSEACRVVKVIPVRGQQGAEPGYRRRRPWQG